MPAPQQNDVYTRTARIGAADAQRNAPATLDEQARTVGVILATENPVSMWDWDYGRVDEVLLMSGVVLPANGQCPLLDSHNRWKVGDQLGSLRTFSVQGDALYAVAHFSETAVQPFTLVREGHLQDVSVGYKVLEHVFVPEKTTSTIEGKSFSGPVKVVTRWEVKEGSFTPIGADAQAKARSDAPETATERAASAGQNPMEDTMPVQANPTQGRANNNPAPETQNQPAQPAVQPEVRADAAPASQQQGPSAESIRTELADIVMLGRMHNCPELAEDALRKGTSLDSFRGQVLNAIAARSEQNAPGHAPHVEMGRGDTEKFRAAASHALLMRAGSQYAPKELAPGAEELRGYTLKELARESLRMAGLNTGGESYEMIGRAFTTSDFPQVLADVAHKAVITGAQEAAETFGLWTGEVTATDFREHTGVSLDAFSSLDIVPEDGEYKHGDMSDSGVKYYVSTYGKLFKITRQAIINDNLNVFTAVPSGMGRAAMRTCGNSVYALITENPQLADGKALFDVSRGNLAASGAKFNADSFGAGVVSMGTHKGKQGEALNIAPVYMLSPVSKKGEALTMLNSQFIGTQAQPNQHNPWANAVEVVTEARLDMHSKTAWYLAGPKGWSINVAWLFGNKTPRVEQRQGFTSDGVEHKISLDFGCFVNDYRALYKNPGA